jgi:hypothetical protein
MLSCFLVQEVTTLASDPQGMGRSMGETNHKKMKPLFFKGFFA